MRNIHLLRWVYFHILSNSNLLQHQASAICSMMHDQDFLQRMAWEVLQKVKVDCSSIKHPDNMIEAFSIHIYPDLHNMQDSMGNNLVFADNHAIRYWLHQCNQKLSRRNHQSKSHDP